MTTLAVLRRRCRPLRVRVPGAKPAMYGTVWLLPGQTRKTKRVRLSPKVSYPAGSPRTRRF